MTQVDWQPGHWPHVGVGVVVVRDGRVLFGRRISEHATGTWSMPGGKQEAGESIEDAGARELLEETGLVATGVIKAPVFTDSVFAAEGNHFVALYVIATVPEGEPRVMEPDKFAEWRWVSWDEIPEPHFPAMAQLFAQGYRPPGA